jgi:hypothetical protein
MEDFPSLFIHLFIWFQTAWRDEFALASERVDLQAADLPAHPRQLNKPAAKRTSLFSCNMKTKSLRGGLF